MKRSHGDKEQTEIQKLKTENQSLKKKLSTLRKQLSRIDVDRYQELRRFVDQEAEEQHAEERAEIEKQVGKLWKCHDCIEGTLRMVMLERRDGVFYYRKCDACPKRTKTQRHDGKPKEGIQPEEAVESSKRDEDPKA